MSENTEFVTWFLKLLDACQNPLERNTLCHMRDEIWNEYIKQVKETF